MKGKGYFMKYCEVVVPRDILISAIKAELARASDA